ncbi:MAG TPA: GDP-mannose 4,6-dehydratase [Candidatus Edwardsbacteria bacterium]|nr:GDP-mannose 4,6-dehydratase [Candidatus Edwardsbacteria bacterium]
MKSFITGIEGFAGHYLAQLLRQQGQVVAGCFYDQSQTGGLPDGCELHRLDLRDYPAAAAVIAQANPDRIYHLAAQSSAARSFQQPRETFDINVGGWVNLLEAVRQSGAKPRILLVSSCEVYGPSGVEKPITETQAYNPVSPYAASKVMQEIAALQYARSYGMDLVIARPFPHVGPGQPPQFALPSFAQQIAAIVKQGREAKLRVGNLQARRDLSDVRDVAEAYLLLAERGRAGEAYNICSGAAISIEQALRMLLAMSGRQIAVEVDPARLRPSDVPVLWGDNTKIKDETGWAPRHTVDQALRRLLDHWLERA